MLLIQLPVNLLEVSTWKAGLHLLICNLTQAGILADGDMGNCGWKDKAESVRSEAELNLPVCRVSADQERPSGERALTC